jgi:non-ribosomal peptide synthetase component E (peptide arylation enzyme)
MVWLEEVELGLTLWSGQFEEEVTRLWLRWCDRDGQVIPTGAERAEMEHLRAETERRRAEAEQQRAERLAERLRSMGVDPGSSVLLQPLIGLCLRGWICGRIATYKMSS